MALRNAFTGQTGPNALAGTGERLRANALQAPMAQNVMAGLGRVQTAVDSMIPFVPGFSLPMGLGLYHGTPHKWAPEPEFPQGRFLLGKIGTGEGAQAYGHGAYFAESPGVAGEYQRKLSSRINAGDYTGEPIVGDGFVEKTMRLALEETRNNIPKAKKWAESMSHYAVSDEFSKGYIEASKRLGDLPQHSGTKGTTYSIDIPVEDVPLLDWDAPLSQQPEAVRKALAKIGIAEQEPDILGGFKDANGNTIPAYTTMTGMDAYQKLYRTTGSQKAASDALQSTGIPGLRYLDQGSRGTGNGTRNYVIWDQDLLNRAKHIGDKP